MHVVFGLDNMGVGGTELNAVRTAERLVPLGIQLSVVCMRPDGPLLVRYQKLGVPVHPVPLRSLTRPSTALAALRLRHHLKTIRPDVFHAHDFYSNAFSVPVARTAGVPFVIASRRWWRSPSSGRAALNRWSYRLAHRILANSESVARLVADEGLPAAKIRVIPNFIEEAAFGAADPALVPTVRAEFQIPADALIFGSVGRLSSEKGHSVLLAAFAKVPGAAHLILVGDGPERAVLENQASTLGLTDRVHFAGTRPSRPMLAGAFDVMVLPSLSEGFPNAVIEAMASARPVIATAVGGTPDALTAECGLLVPPGHAASLAGAMTGLATDRVQRDAFGAAALARARSVYHESIVIPKLLALYAESGEGDPALSQIGVQPGS